MDLPGGTVTFLFTDIEGSTRLWESAPEEMRVALAEHDATLRTCIQEHNGFTFKTVGDAFCAAFAAPANALRAAVKAQAILHRRPDLSAGPLRVRMAIHSGYAEQRDGDYFGPVLNRAARLLATAHGGQVILSHTAQALLEGALEEGVALRDLGMHRLRDLAQPENVYQVMQRDLPDQFPALRSLDIERTNIPIQLTSFIGREKEMGEIRRLLGSHRLVTLAGSGGCGKTRLALQVAAEQQADYADGVWIVELAALTHPALVAQELATVLGVAFDPAEPIAHSIAAHLRARQMLLILDNCEHLLDAVASLCDTLLRSCPKLSLIATSREPINLSGETTYRIPSLTMPEKETRTERLLECDSVRLFIDRAVTSAPDFAVRSHNAAAVAQVCRRLDGIPLAIELAAARIRVMPVEQLVTRLDDRFRTLSGGPRTALPRQRTLRALIDWSYDLLAPTEQLLLSRLSVFQGSWRLAAAEQVCTGGEIDPFDVLDLMGSLVEKSLVVYELRSEDASYRLMETVRQYALERLTERGELEETQRRHCGYYQALAAEAAPKFMGPEQSAWMDRIEAEHDNFRAALDWATASPADTDAAARIAGSLHRFWAIRGYLAEGRRRAEAALAVSDSTDSLVHAELVFGAGNLTCSLSDFAAASRYYNEALEIYLRLGDKIGASRALGSLGNVAQYRTRYDEARALFEQSLALSKEMGNRVHEAITLSCLAGISSDLGDYENVRAYTEQSLALNRALGNRGVEAHDLNSLGLVEMHRNNPELAEAYFTDALKLNRELGHRTNEALNLQNLASVVRNRGDLRGAVRLSNEALALHIAVGGRRLIALLLEFMATNAEMGERHARAATLLAAAAALRTATGSDLSPEDRAEVEETSRRLLNVLTAEELAAAREEGASIVESGDLRRALEPEEWDITAAPAG